MLPMDGDLTPEPFLVTPAQERGVSLSPDGRWVAYVSDESGRDEVYVRPYPGPGGQVTISTGGGEEVVWGQDSSELFYRNGDQVMVVKVSTAKAFLAEAAVPLFVAPYAFDNAGGGAGNPNYDISPDGNQFVFVEQDSPTGLEGAAQINVVLNWFEELKERVPVP
jgi:serine/threonine-protein kinase